MSTIPLLIDSDWIPPNAKDPQEPLRNYNNTLLNIQQIHLSAKKKVQALKSKIKRLTRQGFISAVGVVSLISSKTHRTSSGAHQSTHSSNKSKSGGSDSDGDGPQPPSLHRTCLKALTLSQFSLHHQPLRARLFFRAILTAIFSRIYAKVSEQTTSSTGSTQLSAIALQTNCILRMPEAIKRTGLSRSMIYYKINHTSKYYDPLFPRPIKLGLRSIGFLESEIEGWILKMANNGLNGGRNHV